MCMLSVCVGDCCRYVYYGISLHGHFSAIDHMARRVCIGKKHAYVVTAGRVYSHLFTTYPGVPTWRLIFFQRRQLVGSA